MCSWTNPYSVWIATSCKNEIVLWMVENFSDKLVSANIIKLYCEIILQAHFVTLSFWSMLCGLDSVKEFVSLYTLDPGHLGTSVLIITMISKSVYVLQGYYCT